MMVWMEALLTVAMYVLGIVLWVLVFIIAIRLPGYMTRQEARTEVIVEAVKLLSEQLDAARASTSQPPGASESRGQ